MTKIRKAAEQIGRNVEFHQKTSEQLADEVEPILRALLKPNLVWSEPSPPNGDDCFCDHVKAITPFGEIMITWKSWKEHPSYDVEHEWDGPWPYGDTLQEAKDEAQKMFAEKILQSLGVSES